MVTAQEEIRLGGIVVLLLRPRRPWPWSCVRRAGHCRAILYVIGIAAMVFLALRPRSLFLFLVVWTSQHWILATGLASQLPRAERHREPG